jgi:hypothetical protein
MGKMRNAYEVLVGKPEGKRLLKKDSIKMDFREIELEVVDWIELAEERNQ